MNPTTLDKLNKITDERHGEYGFTSLDEDEMESLINKNPKLLK